MSDADETKRHGQKLIDLGKARGFLTFDDVYDNLPDELSSGDQIDAWLSVLREAGIEIVDSAPKVTSDEPSRQKLGHLAIARIDGMSVPLDAEREEQRRKAKRSLHYAAARTAVLEVYRSIYSGGDQDETTILSTDPNDFDLDPSMFYEQLEERFGVPQDPDNDYFGGYGGTVEDTIAFLAVRWDGKLRR